MRVKISKSKNSVSYSIIENVFKNGKRTTQVVKTLGNEKEILKNNPGVNPREWAEEQAQILRDEKNKGIVRLNMTIDSNDFIQLDKNRYFNTGYLFIKKIMSSLRIPYLCKKISEKRNFSFDLEKILSLLIYTRILYPKSKKGSFELSNKFLEPFDIELHQIYRALDVLSDHKDEIEAFVYQESSKLINRNTKILYYDCTNFFFEISEEDDLRKYGISKENRPKPIVQFGLFMDGSGIPLGFNIFPGNENEQGSLIPIERRILKDFNLSDIITVTDAGLSSLSNRKFNNKGNRGYITTQSIKKLKAYLKDWALDPKGWRRIGDEEGKEIDLRDISCVTTDDKIYYKERWINDDDIEQRLIITYRPKYQNYQRNIREKQINRAINKINHPSSIDKNKANDPKRFIESIHVTDNGEISEKTVYRLNEDAIEKEEIYDGLYGVCTNVEGDISEIISVLKNRWEIEESFRIMKTEFKSRPIYLSLGKRIEAHFLTCFLSLLIFRILEKKINKDSKEVITSNKLISTLREMSLSKLSENYYIPTFTRTEVTDKIHQSFNFRLDKKIYLKKDIRNIMKESRKVK